VNRLSRREKKEKKMSDFEIYGDDFTPATPNTLRENIVNLLPRRFSEFVCYLAQHRKGYSEDSSYKPYDALCKKHKSTREIANYLLAAAHNEAKPSAAQVKHLFDIPEATTYKVCKALREIGYIDNCWKPLRPLTEVNKERCLAFFDSPVFWMFIQSCCVYYIVRRSKKIEEKFSMGYWLNLFDEKPSVQNPVDEWIEPEKNDSRGESD
tara:strand:- start:860 stop:1486 length:627 start_codon:yes stop_codon:yes gene_type:complete